MGSKFLDSRCRQSQLILDSLTRCHLLPPNFKANSFKDWNLRFKEPFTHPNCLDLKRQNLLFHVEKLDLEFLVADNLFQRLFLASLDESVFVTDHLWISKRKTTNNLKNSFVLFVMTFSWGFVCLNFWVVLAFRFYPCLLFVKRKTTQLTKCAAVSFHDGKSVLSFLYIAQTEATNKYGGRCFSKSHNTFDFFSVLKKLWWSCCLVMLNMIRQNFDRKCCNTPLKIYDIKKK